MSNELKHLSTKERQIGDLIQFVKTRTSSVSNYTILLGAGADPRVDAVFVCTPQAFHVEHARLAARGGKALLIEKPVARTLAELAEIEAVVRTAGVLAMVAENYHFKPAVRVLREHAPLSTHAEDRDHTR